MINHNSSDETNSPCHTSAGNTETDKLQPANLAASCSTPKLSSIDIEAALKQQHADLCLKAAGGKIHIHKTIDSTNAECRRIAAAQNDAQGENHSRKNTEQLHGTVIIADTQTAGTGRFGRKFYSPAEHGLYMSILYELPRTLTDPAYITAGTAVAVCRALDEICLPSMHATQNKKNTSDAKNISAASPFKIKWVNDIYCHGKKICGILTEGIISTQTKSIRTIIIGIGINISETDASFPTDIASKAGSIFSQIKKDKNNSELIIDRNILAAAVLKNLFIILQNDSVHFMDEYKKRSIVLGKLITVSTQTESYPARAVDITNNARLIVEPTNLPEGTANKRIELNSGEISIRLP